MVRRLKDFRRIATRYDRLATNFLAIYIAALYAIGNATRWDHSGSVVAAITMGQL